MSTTVDSKVVEMRFDNKNFESNVATTMSTLGRLKQALNLNGASKGLDDVASSAGRVNGPMSGIASAVETVRSKFSALEVMGVTALANLTNSAVNAGKRIVSALTIEPIKMGFQEYETQMNAVQTIMANTSSKGTTLKDVNSALDELNTYADKTIYNFTEMTRNIGTFTAAGVDLDTSVSAIKGIANLAAVSGSTSQQASTAMYQLSQALANGKVNLQDWNSVVNAGMGGEVFQNALKRTAKNMGTDVDALIKKYGSFRESLTKGEWLTTDVLTKTLEQFTMAAKEGSEEWEKYKKSLMAEGYTEKQAIEILKMANTATDAATKVKTLTQLWDTLKEAAQSGWAQSWKIIVGDFEEAKALFTEISDTLGAMIGNSAESRNKVLQGWKDMGGRTALIDSLKNAFEGVMSMVKPIGEAFREIFPPITAKTLYDLTQNLKKFTEGLKLSGETSDKVKRIFKGLFSIVDIVRKVITTATKALFGLSQSDGIGSLADFVLDTAAAIGDFFTNLNKNFDTDGLSGIFSTIGSGISGLLKGVTGGLRGLGEALSSVGQWIVNTAKKIWNPIKNVFTWIKDNVSIGDVFAGLAGGGIFVAAKKFSGVFDKIKEVLDNLFGDGGGGLKALKETFTDVLDSVKDSLSAFTSGIKVWSLVGIAVAVGILAHSLRTLSELKAVDIGKSLLGIGIGLSMLTGGFKSMTKSLSKFESGGIVKSAFSLILVAKALDILADVMAKMGKLSLAEIGKGLVGIGGGLLELSGALKIIGQTKISLSTSVAVVALAYACGILGDALKKFGEMSWSEIGRGLSAMGGALGEVTAAVSVLGKFGGGKSLAGSIGIFITVKSLSDLAEALKKFGQMNWSEIGRGLSAMGGALGELGIVLGGVGKLAGLSSLFAAGAIWTVIQGLDDLAEALKKFGQMDWDEIGRGLTGMGGALSEVGIVTGALGKLTGFSGIFGSGAILITIQGLADLATALKDFGGMSWSEIGKGLSGMGGALTEVAGISGALGKIAGFSGILGSGSILIAIQGLGDLADAFKKFGEMSWEEIGRGLVGMGGALIEVGGITGALGYLTNFAGLLGSASIWTAVQGLGDLADAFKKFGEMSWDEIGRGLSAMGGALGELALGGLLNTLSIIGSYSISEVAEPLGVLADSVKKWAGVTIPENLGIQLSSLASGVLSFTFGGSGASAIATMAEPLGALANSVTKWTGVVVPENLGEQLGKLADGVKKFTFGGLGASAIADVGVPLGQLADSVNKWTGVTIPENLSENLTDLANSIKAFSWAFMGGWSISTIITPLTQLPDAISKWTNVKIPTTLKDDLTDLADGIKAFSWAFMGGWSISAIITPLGDLAGAVKKWTGIKVPEGLKDSLKEIADGIAEFGFLDIVTIQAIDDNLMSLSKAFKNFSSVKVSGDTLVTFAKNIKSCSTELSGISFGSKATEINKIVGAMKKVNSTSVGNVGKFVSAANSLNDIDISKINVDTGSLSSAVKAIKDAMSSMSKTISSSKDSISKAMTTAMSGTSKAITAKKSEMTSAAKKLTDAVSKSISGKKNTITNAFKTLVSGGASAIRGKYSSFYSAGSYLVTGFANGISANSYKAAAKSKAMAEAAVKAAKEALAINSPSKVFRVIGMGVPEGFAQGISKFGSLVNGATRGMTDTAVNSTKRAISKLADIVVGNIDTQPTIRPVVDLSNVKAGAAAVSGMFATNPSVGLLTNVGSISSIMNRRNQNGGNDDVISAIKDLKKALNKTPGNTYQFGDITYGDDSVVSDAVQALTRAILRERRT